MVVDGKSMACIGKKQKRVTERSTTPDLANTICTYFLLHTHFTGDKIDIAMWRQIKFIFRIG